MRNDIRTGVLAIIVFTVLLGLAYPLAMTGAGQAVFPNDFKPKQRALDLQRKHGETPNEELEPQGATRAITTS